MKPEVEIYDTTLRDGTQGEGINLSVADKLRIADRIDAFGIHYIEGGWPGSNPRDLEFFRQAAKRKWRHARIAAFSMTRRKGVAVEKDDLMRQILEAETPVVTIVDRTTTSERGTTRELSVTRPLGQSTIEVRGTMPIDDRGFNASVAVARPALVFVTMLRAALERLGVSITGQTRTVDAQTRADNKEPLQVSSLVEVATRQSPPLALIAARTLKPSQNLYAW